jgi:hypothetical protein
MSQLPAPLRAAIGVIATIVDDRRNLPDKALELPVLAISIALQISLRAQQRYAALTAKGDEVLAGLRGAPEEPPSWARFDEPYSPFGDEPDVLPARQLRRLESESGDGGTESGDNTPESGDDADAPVTTAARPKKEHQTRTVNAPRTGTLSAFDRAADEPGTDAAAED